MRSHHWIVVSWIVFGFVERADAQKLGIYGSPDCTMNFVCVPPGPPFTAYVMVDQLQQPWWSYGLGSAEFSITGIPPSWPAFATPNPALFIVLGDPLGSGCAVGFIDPLPTQRCVLLYTLTLHPFSLEENVAIGFAGRTPPAWPNITCANLFYPCDFPSPTKPRCFVFPLCVETSVLHVRSMLDCQIGVEQKTWRSVKNLYR